MVAGYGEEPPDPPGARPYRPVRDLPLPDTDLPGDPPGEPRQGTDRTDSERPDGQRHDGERPDGQRHDGERPDRPGPGGDRPAPARPLGGSVSFAPGVGPRDYSPPERSGDDYADDEGHFVPPEPPPLPDADVTAKFAWLAVIGGPVLLLLAVLLGWEMTWWLTTVCVGGFLGGFATLVVRMNPGDEDDDDPGRGAVV
ncbi:hypothetical protein [Streptomyces sp. NPDC004065]|uniref:hypothetical protein n=1 Tax=Streptomyces sp. NPDC004065 TaxID=3364689 RepID=UPI00384C5E24